MEKVNGYSTNLNVQMLVSLMLEHGIKRVIVSPGSMHASIVPGFQYNGNFEMYSTVDERGAAYMACGMAAESGEPVAIVCTESVASRNYYPAIAEAYYRKLPILAITGVHDYAGRGHLQPQTIDRSESPTDTFNLKVHLPVIKNKADIWESNILINKALLELKRHGGGPVHIDLPRSDENNILDFTAKTLCKTRCIRRYTYNDRLPKLPDGKIAVFVGTHAKFTEAQSKALDAFCAAHNAVAFCGHTSGYKGKYKVMSCLAANQSKVYDIFNNIDVLIHIGEPAADEATFIRLKSAKEVWRVSPDGEIRDTFKKLTNVFEMNEDFFFENYRVSGCEDKDSYLRECLNVVENLAVPVENLPFSNVYAASCIAGKLPENSIIHLGLSNTIRIWSMFNFPESVCSNSNTGTRGIDGVMSSFLGASFAAKEKLLFCVNGDLSFFYDLNSLGNRDIGNNIRILLVNDGGGGLFKHSGSESYIYIGEKDLNPYIAAAGHFGNKSRTLVKGYAESLGFEYLTASNRAEFDSVYERFITPEITDKPMLFEIFTDSAEERKAIDMMKSIDVPVGTAAKHVAKKLLGQKRVNAIKKVVSGRGK